MGFLKNDSKYIINTYNRTPIEIVEGDGVYVTDINGDVYLDMFSGIAVNSLGHKNEGIMKAAFEQIGKYIHVSNYFASEPVVELAKLLVENTFAEKVFFTNSGAESNEAAIKIARKYGRSKSEKKIKILSAHNSFHGRTCGSLALTGQKKYQESFEPLIPGVDYFDFNSIESIKSLIDEDVCAVFIEAIQGEGGIVEVDKEFLQEVKKLSLEYDFLLIVDEIQAGIGRTGKFLSCENYDVVPDMVTVAKGLGGGFPVGAVLAGERCCDVLVPGDHGTTFGPSPVACAVGLVVVKETLSKELLDGVVEKENYIRNKVNELSEKYPGIIKEVRGKGLMLGINTGEYANLIKEEGMKRKMLLNVTAGNIVRIVPALNITFEEIDKFIELFEDIIKNIKK
ncbi:acetylornithine aminotransferase apoenzyme [Dethiosulfatibacter aminovorans DSM 17477]|uniref:Acetylornithine aminotransferase n=1 Tax=Dethiosulfatibacter aminovorans DSM 17477 TaxID=1121476 RepID=A0A1M6H4Q9_9FIRM|nr:aspartate aminotransferase family protein [Dethiosulfatibacter aminovorans]SHJ17247.1 acetylornithine aminotransferase apoenzyme [Dethiosulfatibacter aminovorans DSM 17477]